MNTIAHILCSWYDEAGRDLKWRHTRDPYLIWLSEIILQQTRVEQGTAYYLRFAERFPKVELLAAASEDEVLKLWQGLGYYSRARNLHTAAQQIVSEFGGVFPKTYDKIRSLKGVGDYTAAAIASAAYDLPCAAVDGNVYRVLSRLYDVPTPIDTTAGRREFQALADATMAGVRPSAYNQAMMDLGAMICTPRAPRCGECPLMVHCQAFASGDPLSRPVKQGKTKVRERWFNYLHLTAGNRVAIHRRGEGDIWQGLYEFPLMETSSAVDFKALQAMPEFREWVGADFVYSSSTSLPAHRLSHQLLHAVVWRVEVENFTVLSQENSCPESELGDKAVPRLLDKYLTKKGESH